MLQFARRQPGQEGVAVAGTDGLGRNLLHGARDVGDDLEPGLGLGPAAHRHDAPDVGAEVAKGLDVVPDTVADALQRGAEQVFTGAGQAQPGHHAARVRVVDGRALAAEVRQHDHAVGSGGHGVGGPEQRIVGPLFRQVAGQFVGEPTGQAAGSGHARRQVELTGERAAHRPDAGIGRRGLLDQDKEGGRAVHHHQIAGVHHADADGLAQGVHRAHRDGRAFQQAGLGRRLGRDVSGQLVAPTQAGQHVQPFATLIRIPEHGTRERLGPAPGLGIVERHEVAGLVVVDDPLAGQAVTQVAAGGTQRAGSGPDSGFVLAQPADLGADGLTGVGHQAVGEDGGLTELKIQRGDLGVGASVDAVEDAGTQRDTVLVDGQQAGADGAEGHARDAVGVLTVEQGSDDLRRVAPPDAVCVLFGVTRLGKGHPVRQHLGLQDAAAQIGQHTLAAVRSDIDANEKLGRRWSGHRSIITFMLRARSVSAKTKASGVRAKS